MLCSTAKVKIVPHNGYRRSEIWRQNYTFLGRNQHELCKKKKNGHRIHHFYPIFKKNLWETPNLWPYCMKIKNALLGFIWSSKAEVKILPHQVYRSFEGKNYTSFWRRNQHEFCKKNWLRMHHLHPIFKNVSGVFQGPHLQEGYPLPHPSPSGASRRFDYPHPLPQQWTLWIRQCST